ncbi:MAG TPA: molybdopterin-dependent oxidoreductase [Gemmataceae bacterium]|nr:molybdopterin-dependent oxidoreductase [Gemmataceae bacterium]
MTPQKLPYVLDRRAWLRWTGVACLTHPLIAGCGRQTAETLEPAGTSDFLMRFPEKVALRVLNDRPPCLETPWSYFGEDLTPNEAFYVRWHLQGIPTSVDLRTWRLKIGGHVEKPLELSMTDLRRMEAVSVAAVNQCSGNSRSLAVPHVPGAQWRNGAMGNARWTGVPLRALLRRAGLKAKAVQATFNGLDEAPLPSVPDFVKALDIEHALQAEAEVLVAYEMNGAPLPLLNGFPVRLVVPGWYATYWIKALSEIVVLPHRFDGYWMAKAYRIPVTAGANETPGKLATKTEPIGRMNVRSFFVRPAAEERLPAGRPCELNGVAFNGGTGIKKVQFSTDGGATWMDARLGDDLGRYSFRRWRGEWTPPAAGEYRLQVRAAGNDGETQTATANWNRGGYMRNVIEEVKVTAG